MESDGRGRSGRKEESEKRQKIVCEKEEKEPGVRTVVEGTR